MRITTWFVRMGLMAGQNVGSVGDLVVIFQVINSDPEASLLFLM